MLKDVEVPKPLQFLVARKIEVRAAGKLLGEINILHSGRIEATTSHTFSSIKAAERWLQLI